MSIKLVRSGEEPGIAWAMAWLERQGMPAKMVRRVVIDAEVGKPMTITATMIVPDPGEDLEVPA